MITIVVATRNRGKLAEITQALAHMDLAVIGLDDFPGAPEVIEDGETFMENAAKKALAIARHTGTYALADDSGLVVDALGGAPGVRSARFAGTEATDEDNNKKLVLELSRVSESERTARFVAMLVAASPDGDTISAEGSCEGLILETPRGNRGFGYDPLFFYPPLNKTFAELSREEKLSVSHRGRALRDLSKKLPAWLKSSSQS